MLQRLPRIFRTVRHLKPSQLFWFVRRRVIKSQSREIFLPDVISARDWRWPMVAGRDAGLPDTVTFRFLNVERQFSLNAVDWAPKGVSRLWRYNLHYFDFLVDADRAVDEKNALIPDWINHNPPGSEPAWESYTASLRIVNWCKWLSTRPCNDTNFDFACRSLYGQALWLEQNLELHILANHYLENLKALVFAGGFFEGDDAARWLRMGIDGLKDQLPEQILADGCHYERAPQYHCVILDDVLDLLQLGQMAATLLDAEFVGLLHNYATRMSTFLQAILNSLGQYPLFNDSAFYEDSPLLILQRAESLGIVLPELTVNAVIEYPAAGLFGYRTGQDWLMLDCGEIGPAYQPGHTHCDFLSYELVMSGIPVVVDTGVFEYEPGIMRQWVRSTAAHNTVQVDDAEQSEIWGEFRVARRAKKLSASIVEQGLNLVFDGGFEGFHSLGRLNHHRRVTIERDTSGLPTSWQFVDRMGGKGVRRLRSYIHLHPEITPQLEEDRVGLYSAGRRIADLRVSPGAVFLLESSFYCPEFGLKLASQRVVIELQSALPVELGYSIIRRDL